MERAAIERLIDRIEVACGLDTFMSTLLTQLHLGNSLPMIRKGLPHDITENKLRVFIGEFFPEFLPGLDLHKAERREEFRRLRASIVAAKVTHQSTAALIAGMHDAKDGVFKYFTEEWYYKFCNQKMQAKHREVEWDFDFLGWITWWVKSGHIDERGRTNDTPYQMCRYGDVGPYSADNCYCATGPDNRVHAKVYAMQKYLGPNMIATMAVSGGAI